MNKAKRPFRPYSERGVTSERPFTECLCPKCGTIHKIKIKWTGRGIPRKFCEKCKARIGRSMGLSDEVNLYTIYET